MLWLSQFTLMTGQRGPFRHFRTILLSTSILAHAPTAGRAGPSVTSSRDRHGIALATLSGPATVGGVTARRDDKTRMVMMVAAVLWISAIAAIFVAMRLRMKPLFLVGLLDGMLALFITTLAVQSARLRRLDR